MYMTPLLVNIQIKTEALLWHLAPKKVDEVTINVVNGFSLSKNEPGNLPHMFLVEIGCVT